ncbi:hypothetical protein DFJ74DRAFT_714019 [Hyaloraphidium curvatum]|nr:hypothetical protein DFJ74DRAFT_714019 [Hyaloraphidium curvatum]
MLSPEEFRGLRVGARRLGSLARAALLVFAAGLAAVVVTRGTAPEAGDNNAERAGLLRRATSGDTTEFPGTAAEGAWPQRGGAQLPVAAGIELDAVPDPPPPFLVALQQARVAAHARAAASLSQLGPPSPACFEHGAPEPLYDTVILLAQGRSGSTSLLRLLNSLPCTNIRGENPALFIRLLGGRSFRQGTEELQANASLWTGEHWDKASTASKPAWWNRVEMSRVDGVLKLLIEDTLEHVPGKIVSGWKSIILFLSQNYDESVHFLDDWIRLFPRTLILLLTRKGVEKSGWWRITPDSAMKLQRQAARYADFVAAVEAGRYRSADFPGAKVAAVPLDYDNVVACRGLEPLFSHLGQRFDPDSCRRIMGVNVEDYGITMSDYDFSTEQGHLGWTYGFRAVNPLSSAAPHGPFRQTTEIRDPPPGIPPTTLPLSLLVPPPDKEHLAVPHRDSPLALGVARHWPSLSPNKRKAAATCRKWTSHVSSRAAATVAVPLPIARCDPALYPHNGYHVHLLVDGSPAVSRSFSLGGPGGGFRHELELKPGTELELCVAPAVERPGRRGDLGLCGPLAATLAVVRIGSGG